METVPKSCTMDLKKNYLIKALRNWCDSHARKHLFFSEAFNSPYEYREFVHLDCPFVDHFGSIALCGYHLCENEDNLCSNSISLNYFSVIALHKYYLLHIIILYLILSRILYSANFHWVYNMLLHDRWFHDDFAIQSSKIIHSASNRYSRKVCSHFVHEFYNIDLICNDQCKQCKQFPKSHVADSLYTGICNLFSDAIN